MGVLLKKAWIGRLRYAIEGAFYSLIDHSRVLICLLFFLVWLGSVALLIFPSFREPKIIYSDDQAHAANTIISEFDCQLEDHQATQLEQEKNFHPCFCLSSVKTQSILNDLENRLKTVKFSLILKSLIQNKGLDSIILEKSKMILERGVFDNALFEQYDPLTLINVKIKSDRYLDTSPLVSFYHTKSASKLISRISLQLIEESPDALLLDELALLIAQSIEAYHGNFELDEHTKNQLDCHVRDTILIMREIKKGDVLIRQNQKISENDKILMKNYSDHWKRNRSEVLSTKNIFEKSIIVTILMLITAIYLSQIHPDLICSNRNLWTLGVAILSILGINYVCVILLDNLLADLNISTVPVSNLIPLGLAAAVLTPLIGFRIALFGGLFVSLLTAIQLDGNFNVLMAGLILSCVLGLSVIKVTDYRRYFFNILIITFCTLSFIRLLYACLWGQLENSWQMILMSSFINAISTAVFALILLFILEFLFSTPSNMSLVYLSTIDHPLLQKLQSNAPGTFFHSQTVALLAEKACLQIGANPKKARAMALFHDIGKLYKPEYFSENNAESSSIHDNLEPIMSVRVIRAHVGEGIHLAIENNLPVFIRKAIERHHGTDAIRYFLDKEQKNCKQTREPIDEQAFHYTGPLADEKEIAIVSLADACEAACKSLNKPGFSQIEDLINDIFLSRLQTGQLDAVDLTFKELSQIKKSFILTLTTMYHVRPVYPSMKENDSPPRHTGTFASYNNTVVLSKKEK